MRRPCVRVERAEGESTRRRLEEAGLRDPDVRITNDETYVYIPVTDPAAVPAEFTVTERQVPPRAGQRMPEDDLPFTPTYERLGDLILLQEEDPQRAEQAAEAFQSSDLPVDTVLNRISEVKGEERVPEWTVLVGERTETVHREYGATFLVDPTEVYFSPRLATERERVISQVEPGEHVFDMFTGVGPFTVRAALVGAAVVAVDINPAAVRYCRENVDRNGVADRVTVLEGDVREVAEDFRMWADRIIMNLPHSAADFLPVAADLAVAEARIHYYDIQPEGDPYGPGERAIRDALGAEFEVAVANRRIVRSYAPGVMNVCLDVDVARRE